LGRGGIEPPTHGFSVRCRKDTSQEKTKTCKSTETQLTPQLTPKTPKQAEIDTQNLLPDLAEIVTIWPELPEHIKAAIKALIQTHKYGEKVNERC
jgi:hypothetical protein